MAAQGAIYLPFLNTQLVSPFVDFDTDVIKVMLVTSGYTYSSAHQYRSEITNETSGTNYVSSGQVITNVVTNTVGGTVSVNGDDSEWAGAASAAFTFRGAVVYKDTGNAATDPVISYHEFNADQTNSGFNVKLKWSTNFIVAYQTVDIPQELVDLTDVNTATPTNRNVLVADGIDWESRPLVEADISDLASYAPLSHTHAATDVVSGTLADARISQSSVTQHQAALSLTESQISDLGTYIENVIEDLTPQLGGNLDINGNSIVSTPTVDINITPGTTGNVILGTMSFDTDQAIGVGQDNYVLTYDNATGNISLEPTASNVNELVDLSDVNTSTPTNRNVLVADGVDWESRALTEADISDLQAYLTSLNGVTAANVDAEASLDGYVLTSDGAGNAAWEATAPTGLQNVVEDLSPELGGDLDMLTRSITSSNTNINFTPALNRKVEVIKNGVTQFIAPAVYGTNNLDFTIASQGTGRLFLQTPHLGGDLDTFGNSIITTIGSNQDVNIYPDGTGNVTLGTLTFDADQVIGVGQDNYALTYDNGTGLISLEAPPSGELVDDLSPQLGGDLDTNGFNITTAAQADLEIANTVGTITLNPLTRVSVTNDINLSGALNLQNGADGISYTIGGNIACSTLTEDMEIRIVNAATGSGGRCMKLRLDESKAGNASLRIGS